MARTRSTKKPAAAESAEAAPQPSNKYTLPAPAPNPPKVFILPRAATPESRIVTLPHPQTSNPSRYLVCPETGIYEFTRVSAPKAAPRSWLFETTPSTPTTDEGTATGKPMVNLTKSADMFVATAVDPLFLLLPSLMAQTPQQTRRLFLSPDDYFDTIQEDYPHFGEILRWGSLRATLEARMGAVCDTVDAGDEKMYRINEQKLMAQLLEKAQRLGGSPLPPSMEEKFVTKALEAPLVFKKRIPITSETHPTDNDDDKVTPGSATPMTDSAESQSSLATTTDTLTGSSLSQATTAATSTVGESESTDEAEETLQSSLQASPEVQCLQRLVIAFKFICSKYVAPETADKLQSMLDDTKQSHLDLSPLNSYHEEIAKIKAQAAAARSGGDYTRKRMRDAENDDMQMEKKRKLEEEKKRKAQESRGVRNLKKVDTSGMKKLSDFFKKK